MPHEPQLTKRYLELLRKGQMHEQLAAQCRDAALLMTAAAEEARAERAYREARQVRDTILRVPEPTPFDRAKIVFASLSEDDRRLFAAWIRAQNY